MYHGLTLIELMISVVIFAVFSIAVITSLQSSSNLSEYVTVKSNMHAACQRVVLNLADDISSSQIINITPEYDEVTYRRVTSVNPIIYDFVEKISYNSLKNIYNITDTFEGSLKGLDVPPGITKNDLKGFFIIRNGRTVIIGISMKYERTNPIVVSFATEVIIRSLVNNSGTGG